MKRVLTVFAFLCACAIPGMAQLTNATRFYGFPIAPPTASDDGKIYALDWSAKRFVFLAPSGAGTVTSVIIAGTANQITASGTCTITTSGTCTLSLPSSITGVTTMSSLVSVGTISTGTWSATTIALNKGGTGQTTQQAAFDALAPTATRAGDVIYWNGTHYVALAGNNSGTNCLTENSSGVPSWGACSGSGTYDAGNGLTLASTTFSIDTSITADLPSAQTFSGVKTFGANKIILTPGADSGTTAGMVNIDASGNLDWYFGGRIFPKRNSGTTLGDIDYCSNTATPCVPARLAIGSADTFLRANGAGNAPSWNQVAFSNLNGSATVGQLPAVARTLWIVAAGCSNATAGNSWDLPTSNAPAPVCNGTSFREGALAYDDAADETASFYFPLPTGWTGNIDISVDAYVNATSQSVKATIATACVAVNEDWLNPTFNSAQTVTVTSPGTANQRFSFAQSSVTTTGCAAGEQLIMKIGRDTTDTSTSTLNLFGAQVTLRVTPQS